MQTCKPTIGKVLQQGLDPIDDNVQRKDATANGIEQARPKLVTEVLLSGPTRVDSQETRVT